MLQIQKMLQQLSQELSHHPETSQSTLGSVGYFKRSIPNFSKVANPLYSLLKLHPEKSEKQLLWNSEHQQALDTLLRYLTTSPMLAYPDFNQPFRLYPNASVQGLGCALCQYQNGKLRTLGFGSRTLVGAEKKYRSSKLEFLGLKWTICDHFRDYLYYAEHFDVYIDFNTLTYIKNLL